MQEGNDVGIDGVGRGDAVKMWRCGEAEVAVESGKWWAMDGTAKGVF